MLTEQASEISYVNGGTSSQQDVLTALVYGFSLLVNVWAFYRISGGLFNPAVCKILALLSIRARVPSDSAQVTPGMVLAGTLPPLRSLFLVPAQLLACMSAAGLVNAMFPSTIADVTTTFSPGTSIAQGVFIEMFMTAHLTFVVLMLAAEKQVKTRSSSPSASD